MLVPLCWWQVIHFFLTWKLCRHSFVQTAKTMAVKVRTMEWEPIQWSVVNNYGIFLSLCAVVSGSLVGKQLHCRRAFKNIFLKGEDTASWTKAVCFMSRSSTPTNSLPFSLLLLESVFQGRIGKSRLVNQRSGKVGKKEDSRGSRDQESFKKGCLSNPRLPQPPPWTIFQLPLCIFCICCWSDLSLRMLLESE